MNLTYYPEGMFPESLNAGNMSREQLKKHCQDGMILEAVAQSATTGHDLIVDLGDVRGIIPREETAIGISDGTVRDIAILSRVGKPVCFRVTSTEGLWEPHPYVYLSRRAAQQEALDHLLYEVPTGTVLPAVVTHLDRFGAFCDIGCGNVSLLSIEHISISRINHSRDRFSEDRCQHRPEAVLRMPVVEIHSPGLHRGKTPQDQDTAMPVIHRAEAVILPFQGGSRRSFPRTGSGSGRSFPRMNRSGHCCARFRSYFFSNAFHQQIFLIQPSGPSILPC